MDFPYEIIVIWSVALVYRSKRMFPLGNSVSSERKRKALFHRITLPKGLKYLQLL